MSEPYIMGTPGPDITLTSRPKVDPNSLPEYTQEDITPEYTQEDFFPDHPHLSWRVWEVPPERFEIQNRDGRPKLIGIYPNGDTYIASHNPEAVLKINLQ